MSNIDWFNFENKDLDFPIYKENPHISKSGWIVLFISLSIGLICVMSSELHMAILSCIVLILPLLYFLKWDYKALFQKPKAKDVILAVLLFVGYMVYAMLMGMLLENFGLVGGELITEISLSDIAPLLFSIMGEEMVKFIPFIFFLRIFYKYSNNRKLSVIGSVILVMIFFASLHAFDFKMLLYALAIQGFGSIFEYIGYIKTKNILISYTTHICTDLFIYATVLLGF